MKTRSLSSRPGGERRRRSAGRPRGGATGCPPRRARRARRRAGRCAARAPSRGKASAAEGEPARLADGADVSRVEARLIGVHGAHSDADRVRRRPQLVDEPPALLAGDPALARNRQPAVERHRGLVGDERAALRDPRPPGLVLGARLEEVSVLDLHPAARRVSSPPPASGFGSSEAATTRPTLAASTASVQGGVVPWCAHGSMVR